MKDKTVKLARVAQLADDDHLVIEGRLQGIIWGELALPCCKAAQGHRCGLVCSHPCGLAKRCIDRFMPVYFVNYAKWN